jgi:hypothetical protein
MGKGPEKLSEKWLLITSLSGCSLEQKLQSVQELRRAPSQPWGVLRGGSKVGSNDKDREPNEQRNKEEETETPIYILYLTI